MYTRCVNTTSQSGGVVSHSLRCAALASSTLDVIRRLAVALQVSADVLIFGADERGPDGELLLQFEAISKFSAEEKKVIKALLEGMILKHEANAGPLPREKECLAIAPPSSNTPCPT